MGQATEAEKTRPSRPKATREALPFQKCDRFPQREAAGSERALTTPPRLTGATGPRAPSGLPSAEVNPGRFPPPPEHSCSAQALRGPLRGFKASEPTSSAGQGKAHRSRLCSIKKEMRRAFTFFFYWGEGGSIP